MEFIKVIAEKIDANGKPIKSNMGSQFETLIPLSKVIAIIKYQHSGYEVITEDIKIPEGHLKVIQVKSDLSKLFQQADKL